MRLSMFVHTDDDGAHLGAGGVCESLVLPQVLEPSLHLQRIDSDGDLPTPAGNQVVVDDMTVQL